jgi:CheY-like chemotaxis protein
LARKILLADDSVTAQNMGRKILADAGYDVVTVNNGSAALKRINELKPDLIVLDVYMPGYSGLEVCQRIKEADETAHIPVLLTVGKLEPFKPEEARRVRADAHIVKPFEASELLTAITKLEDRMVPQADGSRFSASAAGVERFNGESGGRKSANKGETDTGWKSRIRFPSKKKKEEPEPEPEDVAAAAGATFRDFRKGKGNTGGSIFGLNGPSPGQESSHVPDIPRDITPEELDALSAVAAKLDAPAPAPHEAAPKAENKASDEPIPPAPNRETFAVVASTEAPVETPADLVEPSTSRVEAVEVEAPSSAVSTESDASVQPLPSAAAPQATTNQEVKTDGQEAEGMEGGHSQIAAEGPVAENSTLPAEGSSAESAAASLNVSPNLSPNEEPRVGSIEGDPSKESFEVKPADAIADAALATANQDLGAAEGPAPSDAELTEALRLLTPSTANAATAPSNGKAGAHSQLLAEEVVCNTSGGPRWIAEAVGLSAEEETNSLEAEMFRTFATPTPTNGSASATLAGGELDPERVTGVSAIAAAVENRLAAAGMAVDSKYDSKSWSNQATEHSSDHLGQQSMENAVAEAAAALEASAELLAAASAATPVVDLIGAEVERKIAAELVARELVESEKKNSEANAAEQAPAEEFVSATFADAMGKNEIEAATETSAEVGGQDSMSKAGKTKSGKSDLQQTQTSAVEQTKPAAETASKAMAAAADSSASAHDARTIANIVDSVMADLRPRIVEEIARKLAGK